MKIGRFEVDNIYSEDCYQAIKDIPDKSIDLVYIDPPYQFSMGGWSKSELGQRKLKSKQETYSLDTEHTKNKIGTGYSCGGGCFGTKKRNYHSQINDTDVNLTPERKAYLDYVAKNGKDEESERLRIIANAIDNRQNTHFISKGFSNEILDELCRVMKNIYIYIWCSKEQIRQIFDYFEDKGCFMDLLTWHKTNPIPTCNGTYLSDTEYLILAREKGCKIYGTYETKSKYYISECNVADKKEYEHPTIKPLEFVKNHIINSTQPGDVVLDCFMGSGTTAVACKELNRHFLGFELNPTYWQIAVDRVNGITQQDRLKKNSGQVDIFELLGGDKN